MIVRNFLLVFLLTMAACGVSLEEKVEHLVIGKNKWMNSVGEKDYSFEIRRECFCRFSGETIRVEVNDGISSVSSPYSDLRVSNDDFESQLLTIQALFELALELTKRELKNEGTLHVEFDGDLGYPSILEWENDMIMDASFALYIGKIEFE